MNKRIAKLVFIFSILIFELMAQQSNDIVHYRKKIFSISQHSISFGPIFNLPFANTPSLEASDSKLIPSKFGIGVNVKGMYYIFRRMGVSGEIGLFKNISNTNDINQNLTKGLNETERYNFSSINFYSFYTNLGVLYTFNISNNIFFDLGIQAGYINITNYSNSYSIQAQIGNFDFIRNSNAQGMLISSSLSARYQSSSKFGFSLNLQPTSSMLSIQHDDNFSGSTMGQIHQGVWTESNNMVGLNISISIHYYIHRQFEKVFKPK